MLYSLAETKSEYFVTLYCLRAIKMQNVPLRTRIEHLFIEKPTVIKVNDHF